MAKSGQRLEKDSKPRGLRFYSNKYDCLKKRINLLYLIGARFFILASNFYINRILLHGIYGKNYLLGHDFWTNFGSNCPEIFDFRVYVFYIFV